VSSRPELRQRDLVRHVVKDNLDGHPHSNGVVLEVAYLLAADIVSGLLPIRLREINQPMISTRNRCSRPRPCLLTCI
jgi:hypothetical protein